MCNIVGWVNEYESTTTPRDARNETTAWVSIKRRFAEASKVFKVSQEEYSDKHI